MEAPEKTKIRAINRLKSMYALRGEVDKMYETSEENKAVAWVMLGQWAEPILTSMNVRTVYPENYGSVCAAAGKAGPYLEISDAEGFPGHICGYARNCYGYSVKMKELGGIPADAPMGGMPKPDFLIASGEICDARFKWFQSLGRYFNAPVWVVETSYPGLRESLEPGADERSIKFIVDQLNEFVKFLEQKLGRKMDWDKLDETARGMAALNKVRWGINRLRAARPGPMHSRDFWSSITAALFRSSNRESVMASFEILRDEVQTRIATGTGALNVPEKYRLSFDGLPPWHHLGIFDNLAERGWNFIAETNYRPWTPVNIDLAKYSNPMERFVRERYQSIINLLEVEYSPVEASAIREEIMRTGTSPVLDVKHVKDCQCDGVMIHILLSCRSASYKLPSFQQKVMDVLKVPALVIEGDMVDASLFNPAEVLKKAEAFEETIDHYKQVRKNLGMGW